MMIIDYNGIALGNVVSQSLGKEFQPDIVRHVILNQIRHLKTKFQNKFGKELVIATDGMRNWRYQEFPHYKANRKKTREASDIDWQAVFEVTNQTFEDLGTYFPYRTIQVNSCEADDVIAVVTRLEAPNKKVLIISGDKDFVQLHDDPNVFQYSPILKKFITSEDPKTQLHELIMRGDRDDGVPNILSDDDVFVKEKRQKSLKQDVVDSLRFDETILGEEVERNIKRNRKLIDLSQIPTEVKSEIINTYQSIEEPKLNVMKLMNYFMKNGSRQLIEKIGDFT